MTDHLKHIGVADPQRIEKYTLRTEAENDILKIYYKKEKGDLFHRSLKVKFPRLQKQLLVDSGGAKRYENTSEIAPNLLHVLDELDKITSKETEQVDVKEKILKDLRHLERVVNNKIKEIERDLDKLSSR
ncbi:Chromosome segregation ATPase [Hahella chejuensis KCTC 2396]|uniref:UPF0325 protein HCH_00487 n=1 Tax=Hahella chejuensis (strain KCTC 2396) TaxID=349521 RepID=Y487_HAHCH|nr:DUF3461 family protein [Hahella chejuensis]Q2SPM9.1 RecName: Full=UPF0325 protein HCH_00487 [Hahella chejuensis KCTC 2396]ABC27395.1 Chromosome segregation ATPase [Hahella chejuensis KCTC 2396]